MCAHSLHFAHIRYVHDADTQASETYPSFHPHYETSCACYQPLSSPLSSLGLADASLISVSHHCGLSDRALMWCGVPICRCTAHSDTPSQRLKSGAMEWFTASSKMTMRMMPLGRSSLRKVAPWYGNQKQNRQAIWLIGSHVDVWPRQ